MKLFITTRRRRYHRSFTARMIDGVVLSLLSANTSSLSNIYGHLKVGSLAPKCDIQSRITPNYPTGGTLGRFR